MKFTLSWLKEFLETDASLEQILEVLTAIGLEVEEVTDLSSQLADFSIAQILSAEKHPDAEKLQVCKVTNGQEELQIVCGAANARAGINVVLAPVGSVIPTNGMKIKKSKIRGVESHGMLCSAAELGLGEDHSGIIEMPASNDNIAQNYADFVGLNDPLIEIAITPNRGDCLGVYGIARDLAAAGLGTLKPYALPEVYFSGDSSVNITVKEPALCPFFIGCTIKNVTNNASPEWLKARLEAIGIAPISALVDVTNYIAFCYGRPLHVYDADKLSGGLDVRYAQENETFKALDDKEYTLTENDLVVADNNAPQALAGVIGGVDSGCDETTKNVFLEVALFDARAVAEMGRRHDIITDSRYRFEREVDPNFMEDATRLAVALIQDLCGGEASNIVRVGAAPQCERKIAFHADYVKKRSGMDVSESRCQEILLALGFCFDGKDVTVPSYRPDMHGKDDVVEEILRIEGYNDIPEVALPDFAQPVTIPLARRRGNISRETLVARGFAEVISWSFADSRSLASGEGVVLKNPISQELDVMRPTMITNLLKMIADNANRGFKDVALCEIGPIFTGAIPGQQQAVVTALRAGRYHAKSHYGAARDVDVFDAKSDLFAVLESLSVPVDRLQYRPLTSPYYHPGRSSGLFLGKACVGAFGEIHPQYVKDFDIEVPVIACEIFVDNLPPVKVKKTTRGKLESSAYQASTRDFAFIFDEAVTSDALLQVVRSSEKELITEVRIFDIYRGEHVEPGKKSVAISVTLQSRQDTLKDDQIESISAKVIQNVSQKLGGVLR